MTRVAASFRDPAGSCYLIDQRILRVLAPQNAADCEAFLQTPSARRITASKKLVSTRRLEASEVAALRESAFPFGAQGSDVILEHERVPVPSYPYEWPPEMLWAAGCLTLELAMASLADGYGLKDATPYNVLYRGSEPVFIDVPSFELRAPGDPVWLAYGQFVRTFLLPLLANRRWGLRLADIFMTHRDGLEPEEVYRLCGPLQRLGPKIFSWVSMPTWLGGQARAQGPQLYHTRTLADPEKARFILDAQLNRCQRALDSLKPPARKDSAWSDYMASHSYNEPAFAAKEQFVQQALREFRPKWVLDAGANIGTFSILAAKAGAQVVAIDTDPACVGLLWAEAHAQKLNILPLVVDLSRPSPALGWRNAECQSFLDRATGTFDCVLMLALIHHLLVAERIPLEEILSLAAQLTTSLLIIEFVAPEDEMFRQLTRGREHLHTSLNVTAFEAASAKHFDIVNSLQLPGAQRRMYCLKLKGGTS